MVETVFLGVIAFSVMILSLVSLLMVARNYLVASGEVTVTINDDPEKALKVASGGYRDVIAGVVPPFFRRLLNQV